MVRLTAILVSCWLLAFTFGKPCANNAFFTYAASDNKDYCVCSHGLKCFGDGCTNGSPLNLPSFQPQHEGYDSAPSVVIEAHLTLFALAFLLHAGAVAVATALPTASTCGQPPQPTHYPLRITRTYHSRSTAPSTLALLHPIHVHCRQSRGSTCPKPRRQSQR
jgi:hypothetical protein